MAIIGVSGKIGSGKDTVGSVIQYLTSVYKNGYYEGDIKFMSNRPNIHKYSFEQWKNHSVPTNISDWKIKKYADKLKDIVCILLSCTREQLEDRVFKETNLSSEWDLWQLHYRNWNDKIVESFYVTKEEAINAYNSYIVNYSCDEPKLVFMTPRKLLQLLGTDCGRKIIHPNIWVNATMINYKDETNRIVSPSLEYYPSNWIITDVRFPNEAKAITDKGGINIRIQKHNMFDAAIKSLELEHESETALDNYQFDYVVNHGTIEALIEQIREILIKENII